MRRWSFLLLALALLLLPSPSWGAAAFVQSKRTNIDGAVTTTTIPITCTNQFVRTLPATGISTCGTVAAADIAALAVSSPAMAVVNTYWICAMTLGANNGAVLADADIGPQDNWCIAPAAITVVEVRVKADAGTPSALPRRTVWVIGTIN